MEKILVLGACGFIGTNICERLLEDGYFVSGIDNLSFGKKSEIHEKIDIKIKDIEDVDINYINSFDIIISSYCSNIIYSIDNEIQTYSNNVIKSINIFAKYDGRIINLSTSSLYGNPKYIPTPEISITSTSNSYDTSKYIIEEYLKTRGNYTTLRLTNVFGKYQNPESKYTGVIAKYIYNKLNNNECVIYGNGNDTRDYNYVSNVIDAISIVIKKESLNTEINIGTEREISIKDLIKILNIKDVKFDKGRKIDGINRRCLDITKAKKLLDWEPKVSFEDGLKITTEWIKENYVE